MHLITLPDQELSQIGSILSGDACDECFFGHVVPIIISILFANLLAEGSIFSKDFSCSCSTKLTQKSNSFSNSQTDLFAGFIFLYHNNLLTLKFLDTANTFAYDLSSIKLLITQLPLSFSFTPNNSYFSFSKFIILFPSSLR